MAAPLALERFDGTVGTGAQGPACTAAAGGAPPGNPGAEAPLVAEDEEPSAVDPDEVDVTPGPDKILDSLADVLRTVVTQLPALHRRAATEATEAFATALGRVLPGIVDEAMRAEIAVATARILETAAAAEPRLSLSPGDHEPVLAHLKALKPPLRIAIECDPSLADGSAQIDWPDGGAEIDIDALLSAARQALTRRIGELAQEIARDDDRER